MEKAKASGLRKRLDLLLVERGLCESRSQAAALILAGEVVVNDQRVDKAGTSVSIEAEIRLKGAGRSPYVSRGGQKLAAAFSEWPIPTEVDLALDLGASTGGFTDCLLQKGCRKVIAVDVGHAQLHERLRQDPRVVSFEGLNARYLTHADLALEPSVLFPLIVGDLSFISLSLILPSIAALAAPNADVILLVKPQFEAGREAIGKNGVVRDETIRLACADRIAREADALGLLEQGRRDSPIHGPQGNLEILLWLKKTAPSALCV